jgi:D-amino-acid dehydrogenase
MTKSAKTDFMVVGAGIVGVCIAALLAEAGQGVTVVDRTGIVEETSSGNAAALAFAEVLPLAHKGMLAKVPGWLMDPLGPLTIRPSYLPKLAPWLIRFMRAGSTRNREASVAAQVSLMRLAQPEMLGLMQRAGAHNMLREGGCLELYENETAFKAAQAGYDLRRRYGIAVENIPKMRIADFQPGLSERFVAAAFIPEWKNVSDPKQLGKAIWAYAERNGARFKRSVVKSVDAVGPALVLENGQRIEASKVVIAAGAWSHFLARQTGDRIPLETERGYNTTLPTGAFDVKRQLYFDGHGFVVTPLETGIRVGGAVELAGLDNPPNFARSKAMLDKAKRFMPGLKTEGGRQWMGYRPSLPDSLPVIGRSAASPNVLYAFGHGHLGLTQSAATARLIRDLVTGQSPAIDLAPFSPQRF